jgi:hypothetical protein
LIVTVLGWRASAAKKLSVVVVGAVTPPVARSFLWHENKNTVHDVPTTKSEIILFIIIRFMVLLRNKYAALFFHKPIAAAG